MKKLFFIPFLFLAFFVNAQVNQQTLTSIGNVPFTDIAALAKNPEFRNKVAVAMYIKAAETLVDSTKTPPEHKFASQIVTEGANEYYISIFVNAVLTTGASLETPDPLLYQGVATLWPNIVKAWLYATGYYPANLPSQTPATPDDGF